MPQRVPTRFHQLLRKVGLILPMALSLSPHLVALTPAPQAYVSTDTAIPQTALLQPAELKNILQQAGRKPTILQVGSRTLFNEAHIPGSEYAGAADTPEGLATLREHVATLPRNSPIVLYCGCCPWSRCPNIRPAYGRLLGLGYTNVKVLYLADNFGADWADKGLPVEREK